MLCLPFLHVYLEEALAPMPCDLTTQTYQYQTFACFLHSAPPETNHLHISQLVFDLMDTSSIPVL